MTAAEYRYGLGTAPAAPPAGYCSIYFKNDGLPYFKNAAGVETPFALGGVVGPSNAVYVDVNGNDATGVRGNAAFPYQTIAGGLAACQDGDALIIGPGTYTIAAPGDVPAWPAGVNHLVILGYGSDISGGGGTVILNTVNNGSNIFTPPNTADYIEIRHIYASVTLGAGYALYCDGTGGGGNFLGGGALGGTPGGLVLRDCTLTGATNA